MNKELQIIAKSVITEDIQKENKKKYGVAAGAAGMVGISGYAMGAPYRTRAKDMDATSKVGQPSLIRRTSRNVARAGSSTYSGLGDLYHIFDEFKTHVPPLARKYKQSYKAAPKYIQQKLVDDVKDMYGAHMNRFFTDIDYRQEAKDNLKEIKRQRKEVKVPKKPLVALPSGPDIIDITPKQKSSIKSAMKFILRRGK